MSSTKGLTTDDIRKAVEHFWSVFRTKSEEELRGLVYSLTPHVAKDESLAWYAQPATLAFLVLAATIVLNIIFW